MESVRSFRDLRAYKAAREAANRIFALSKKFPPEERYSLTDQIRRSSRAVKALMTEGWARRRYKAVFISKIDEAYGEATETRSWLDDCIDAGYITAEDFSDLDDRYDRIGGMVSRMIDRADDFCKHPPSTDYRKVVREGEDDPLFH